MLLATKTASQDRFAASESALRDAALAPRDAVSDVSQPLWVLAWRWRNE